MPKMQQYTSEFKDQAVRFVFESIEANESRKEACRRLAPKVNVKEVTLYNWVKAASATVGGSGGGRPDMAQAGGKLPEKLPEALQQGREALVKQLGG